MIYMYSAYDHMQLHIHTFCKRTYVNAASKSLSLLTHTCTHTCTNIHTHTHTNTHTYIFKEYPCDKIESKYNVAHDVGYAYVPWKILTVMT